ncbi:MAG: isoprenylcysteine carboxylmethyltransferase family protein [Proteobacteria bacterium]|nr:isoprenylcysteine carboxylmethyltransferase family protein [Pseudomonadota bacterium]
MSTELAVSPYSTGAKIGRVWFRFRSFSPIPLFLLLVVLTPNFTPSLLQTSVAVLGIFLSEALRIWSVGYAGSATRTRGDSVPQLVHAGPYRYVRNPLYVANIVMYTCAGVIFGFSGLSILIFLFSAVEYIFIVAFEEETLVMTFGAAYENFCEKVPRWFPSFTPMIESTGQTFSLERALRSERSTFISLSMMALLLILKKAF